MEAPLPAVSSVGSGTEGQDAQPYSPSAAAPFQLYFPMPASPRLLVSKGKNEA